MYRILTVIVLLAAASCSTTPSKEDIEKARAAGLLPPSTLRMDLRSFVNRFAIRVEKAATEISANNASTEIRRNAVFWRMRSIPISRKALERGVDEVTLLDLWLLCTRMRIYFESKTGQELFGDKTPIALATSKELEEAIKSLAVGSLTKEAQTAAEKRIEDFIKAHPEEMHMGLLTNDPNAWASAVSSILHQPAAAIRAPFHALKSGIGVSDTVQAIHQAASMVERVRTEVKYLPDNVRWQTDLLLLETEENQATKSALDSFAKIGESSSSIAATAKTLPKELSQEVSQILTEFDEKQVGLQKTLTETRATIEDVDKALGQVEKIVVSTSTSSEDVARMGEALTVLFKTFNETLALVMPSEDPEKPAEPVAPEEQAPPFNINDFGKTAVKLTDTAHSLTAMLQEVRDLTQPERTAALLETTDATVRTVVDLVLVRAALFLLFVVVLLLGYRFVSRPLAKRA